MSTAGNHVSDCLVALVLDMSGSMANVAPEVIEGVNRYTRKLRATQKKEGAKILFSLCVYETGVQMWNVCTKIARVGRVTSERYQPRGLTALYDAIASTISESDVVLRRLMRNQEIGEDARVVVIVLTDGYENASHEYGLASDGRMRIASLIERYQAERDWTFVYIGAHVNQERAEAVATPLGFTGGNVVSYTSSPLGMRATLAALTRATVNFFSNASTRTSSFFADAGQCYVDYGEMGVHERDREPTVQRCAGCRGTGWTWVYSWEWSGTTGYPTPPTWPTYPTTGYSGYYAVCQQCDAAGQIPCEV